jgi:leader peptidase (prepilin peptidase)/N-methyltransferase
MQASSMRGRAARLWTLAVMAGGVVVSLLLLPLPLSLFAAVLAAIAVFIAAIDLEHLVIPDVANVALLVLGLALAVTEAGPGSYGLAVADALARGAAAGGALLALRQIYWWRAGVEGLGLGDAKLAAAGGLWLAWPTLPIALLIASLGALLAVGGRGLRRGQKPDRRAEIPFGAFLAPAIWLAFMLERGGLLGI